MKISIKKEPKSTGLWAVAHGQSEAWDIYVSDGDRITDQEVGHISFSGGLFQWRVDFFEWMGIFPVKGECHGIAEAKKLAKETIKTQYAQWQDQSVEERDQAVLFYYFRQLQQNVKNSGLTEGRNERICSHLDELFTYIEFDKTATDQLLLNCTKDNVGFNKLLDAIIGIAYFSQWASSVSSTVESLRERAESAKMRWVKEEVIRRKDQLAKEG